MTIRRINDKIDNIQYLINNLKLEIKDEIENLKDSKINNENQNKLESLQKLLDSGVLDINIISHKLNDFEE